jgi:hypothetical protein
MFVRWIVPALLNTYTTRAFLDVRVLANYRAG